MCSVLQDSRNAKLTAAAPSAGEDGVAQTHADRQTPPPPTPSTGSEELLPRERCLFVVTTLEAWARLQSRHELYVLQSVL